MAFTKSTDLLHLTVIDSDRGEPVTTEEVKYGIRVAVIAMAAADDRESNKSGWDPAPLAMTLTTLHSPTS